MTRKKSRSSGGPSGLGLFAFDAGNTVLIGGYERGALQVIHALLKDTSAELILNVQNGTTFAGLPADVVVEIPAAEQCTVEAALHAHRNAALKAFPSIRSLIQPTQHRTCRVGMRRLFPD